MSKRVRLFIRPNELSNQMIPLGEMPSVREAIRKVKRQYPTLGAVKLREGLFYGKDYKQVMVEMTYAAYDSIAMIICEDEN